ncbi:unnamed protein product, partial [marine sediment metagenome]
MEIGEEGKKDGGRNAFGPREEDNGDRGKDEKTGGGEII